MSTPTDITPSTAPDPVILTPGDGLKAARLWAEDATAFGLGPAPDDLIEYEAWVKDVASAIQSRAGATNVRPPDVKDVHISLADADERSNFVVTLSWEGPSHQLIAAFDVATFYDSKRREVVRICKDGVAQYSDDVWRVVVPIRMVPSLPQFWFGRGDALRLLHGEDVAKRLGEFWTTKNLAAVVEKAVPAVTDLLKAASVEFLHAAAERTDAVRLLERQVLCDWTVLCHSSRRFLGSPLELGRLVVSVDESTPAADILSIAEVVARLNLKDPANRTRKMGLAISPTHAGVSIGTRLGPRRSEVGAPWFPVPTIPSNHACYIVDWTIEE